MSSSNVVDLMPRSRRPKDSPFFQQKLPAWQPMFTAKKSAITFIALGIIFIPLGALLLITSDSVIEYIVDYTDCIQTGTRQPCSEVIQTDLSCECVKELSVSAAIPGPVFLYYGLDNFYQNHRRYARSKSDNQLLGVRMGPDSLTSCSPYISYTNASMTYAILPCGAIANSIFNDTFQLSYASTSSASPVTVAMSNKGIAWKSDIDRKFGTLTPEALLNTVKPPNWPLTIEERSVGAFKTDEELMVWMRIAALPNFRKLHRRIIHEGQFNDGLPAGMYNIKINYTFPVTSFKGRKTFVIGNVSWLGGKNRILGITCILTGCIHLCLGVLFLVVHFYSNRRVAIVPSERTIATIPSALDSYSVRVT